jgi:disulfide oxidoreductase YuzD
MGTTGLEIGVDLKWLNTPEDHDYEAAQLYLSLIYQTSEVNTYVEQLRNAPVSKFYAKDIFRASGLAMLGPDDPHVKKDQKKIESDKALSPLLLVRDTQHGKVVIADGYHRLCAVYFNDEDAVIPCKIV